MTKIKNAFANGKAFIPFITCGDPSLAISEQLVYAMEAAGADLIELGIPFSDPTAEGPVIQAANLRALHAGALTDAIFEMVARIRQKDTDSLGFHDVCQCRLSLWHAPLFAKKPRILGLTA